MRPTIDREYSINLEFVRVFLTNPKFDKWVVIVGIVVFHPTPTMKKFLSALTLLAATAIISNAAPAQASELTSSPTKNYVGPSVALNSGLTGFGVVGKFGVAENISIRPFANFYGANGVTLAVYGASATYDYNFPNSNITAYGGLGFAGGTISGGGQTYSGLANGVTFTLGADYHVSDSITVNVNSNLTGLNIGAGYSF